jgi:hypothetical protein
MRFIVVLRHPVERAWSAYRYAVANGWEPTLRDFDAALDEEPARRKSGEHRAMYDLAYVNNGMYAQHLRHWTRFFDRSQFLLLRTDDLRDNPQAVLDEVCIFLDIATNSLIDWSKRYNTAREFRWPWLGRLLLSRNSWAMSTFSRLMPEQTRIWTKSRVFPAISRLNAVQIEPSSAPASAIERLESAFAPDLLVLRDEYGVDLQQSRVHATK